MKLTPEEYLKVLHRRNEIELTPEEVKYVKEERLKEHTEWSTYLHYLKKLSLKKNDVNAHADVAEKILIAGKALKMGDIDIDHFARIAAGYDAKEYSEIAYVVRQIIEIYKYPITEPKVADIPPL